MYHGNFVLTKAVTAKTTITKTQRMFDFRVPILFPLNP